MNGGNLIDDRRNDWDSWLDGWEIDGDDGMCLEMEIGDGGVRRSSSDFLYRVTQSSRAWGICQNALPTPTKLPRLSSFGPAIFIFYPVYGHLRYSDY